MSSLLFCTSTSIFILYIFFKITWIIWKRKLSFIPSAPNIPWLGTIPYLSTDSHKLYKIFRQFDQDYNHLYISWFTHIPVVRIGCVEYAEPLLKSTEVLTKTLSYVIIKEWLGDGLLISSGKKWKSRRTALTGAFHFVILNDFMDIFEKHAINFVNRLQDVTIESNNVEIQQLVSLATLDVICETSMGVSINALNSCDSEYVKAVQNIKRLLLKRILNPVTLFLKSVYKLTRDGKDFYECLSTLHNFTKNIIDENIVSRKNQSSNKKINNEDTDRPYKHKKVLIDVLLDLYEKGEIDLDGVREEVDTFMFEGHDTTSSALSWILYEIGQHSEVQAKLHEEIDSVSSRDCSLMDKMRLLKYTECVIKESLRFHPPVPSFGRKLEKDMVINNNIIPSGTILGINVLGMHMNPAYWNEPSVFNPSRFEGEVSLRRNPYCFIPFSAGPRNCIGQKFAMLEEKVFIYYILSHFKIKSLQTPDEVKTGMDIILHAVNGINMEFSVRS